VVTQLICQCILLFFLLLLSHEVGKSIQVICECLEYLLINILKMKSLVPRHWSFRFILMVDQLDL
jgi:hypothetical protein